MAQKKLALALQGGGSHGAYTWGVLDRLLEDDRIEIEGLSGASAGAMNAVVLADGYTAGGREGAREALKKFWTKVSEKLGHHGIAAASAVPVPDPTARAYLYLTRFFSPYQLNPLNINPLRDIVAEHVDFERLRDRCAMKLFISATRVSNGALRIFPREELTIDSLLASACLPSVHHSVEVDGVAYWDGGLTANPPLSALVYKCAARDLLVVVLNPQGNDVVPSTVEAIGERLSQITFSSTLSAELQAIALAKAEAERARFAIGRLDRRLRALNIHVIDSAQYMAGLAPASRYNTDAGFIEALRDEGRARAEAWLQRNFRAIGTRTTVSMDSPLLQS
ncbi:MAG TPA: patatin-like phospholipase family protein [Burkholderiales bacterium]|nr:patatin-like phospholipase family protein [Burkholderiales bacterium]